jgi:GT2 family glycosyltransferase
VTEPTPDLSVIVPVFGDWARLPLLLDALAEQEEGPSFELILVDNEAVARPGTADLLQAALRDRSRVLHCPAPGSYAARNAGAAVARGRALVFTDADCRPEPGWLLAVAQALAERPETLIAGPVRVTPERRPNAWAIYDAVRGIPQEVYVRHGYATTANLALPRRVFEALGGFDARRLSGGDAEFCRRAAAAGVSLRLAPGAVVRHPARSEWAQLATKARRVKGGQVAAGPFLRRLTWTLRSLTPPLREILRFLRSDHPWRWRVIASGVRLLLWAVELGEVVRLLLLGGKPERR